MSPRRAVFLTTRRELSERLRSRAFLVSTGLVLALVAGIFAIAALTDGGPEDVRLAVAGQDDAAIAEAAAARGSSFDVEVEVARQPGPAAARSAVRDGDADLALAGGRLLTGGEPSDQALAVVQAAARSLELRDRLADEGLSTAEAERLLEVAPLPVSEISGADDDGAGLALFASIVLYLAIFTAGLQVATGVVEEKGSRVVEMILSSIRPAQLLVGKVLGIGLTAFLQLILVFSVWLALALGTGEIDLPASAGTTVALVVAYFLLGYAFYACAFAAAAALVSRQEDVQNTTAPMMIALVGSYLVSLGVVEDPSSTLARVCTVLPPVAPMVVPVRAAQDALPAGDLVASLAAMAIGTLVLIRLGARIYERSVLLTGAPVKLSQALRLLRSR